MNAPYSVVSARNLSLTFETNDGPVHALSNVDLEVKKGDFVSFIGPSGCGKTTFLRVIADLEKHTAGEITVNDMTPENARKARSYGYVFQAAALYPWRTIENNIALPLEIMGYGAAEKKKRIEQTLELVNLSGFAKKYPWQLSGGMQQRASIARALAFDADLLLMDEPFGPLDAQTRQIMGNLLLDLWSRDRKALIFVTHDLEEAIALSDRVVVMSAGPAAGIVADYRVPLPRPRDIAEIRLEKAFHEIHRDIWASLRVEVQKAYAMGEGKELVGGAGA